MRYTRMNDKNDYKSERWKMKSFQSGNDEVDDYNYQEFSLIRMILMVVMTPMMTMKVIIKASRKTLWPTQPHVCYGEMMN